MEVTHRPEELKGERVTLGTVRLRLALALIGVAIVASALATLLMAAPDLQTPMPALPLLGAAAAAAAWLGVKALAGVAEMDRSRTRLEELYTMARAESLNDPLTGLGNHRAFQEELDRQLEQSRRYGVELSLILLDLDDFKQLNDGTGHAAGDRALVDLGNVIRHTIRAVDRPFRIGGDEFAILIPHTDPDGARILGRRLLADALRVNRADGRPISFSAGISAVPSLAEGRAELYAQADAALYWGKRHGRTTVEIFEPSQAMQIDRGVTPEVSAMVVAIAGRRALRPVYQPIVELRSGRVIGFEGLVRPEPGTGFSGPGDLFEAAEASGRTLDLDQACIEVVAAGAVHLPDDLFISINISPQTLEAPEFGPATLVRTLARFGLDPHRVVIELTERSAVVDLERLRRNLRACQAAGMRIAADDVGAGNAGLRLLSQMRFDVIKVDLALVQEVGTDGAGAAVLRSIVDLGHSWDALVVAEGIENAEQLLRAREAGIASGQGYLLGRPGAGMEAAQVDIERLLVAADRLPWLPLAATA